MATLAQFTLGLRGDAIAAEPEGDYMTGSYVDGDGNLRDADGNMIQEAAHVYEAGPPKPIHVALAIGRGIQAEWNGGAGAFEYSWLSDSDGNLRLLYTFGGGVGGPNGVSVGKNVTIMASYRPIEPTRLGWQAGGSVLPFKCVSVGGESMGGSGYAGVTGTLGFSTPGLGEGHGLVTWTFEAFSVNAKEHPFLYLLAGYAAAHIQ
jgi:hypothetical protein